MPKLFGLKSDKKNYRLARNYCFKLSPYTAGDLVHDAYIWHYDRTGRNLLEEDNRDMVKVLKNKWCNARFRDMFMWRGVRYYKQFLSIGEDYDSLETSKLVHIPANLVTPEHSLIVKQAAERTSLSAKEIEYRIQSVL